MVTNRSIRLKEWGLNVERTVELPAQYLERCDGTLTGDGFLLRTDRNGFIRTGKDLSGPGAAPEVLVLGDSFVESLFASEGERFPAILETSLRDDYGIDCSVLNAGYSGATSLHLLNTVVNKVRPLLPNVGLVVLFAPMSDDNVLRMESSYWSNAVRITPINPPLSSSSIYDGLDSELDLRAIWSAMLGFLRAFDVPVVVVGTPFRRATVETDSYYRRRFSDINFLGRLLGYMDDLDDAILRVATDAGVVTFDARSFDAFRADNHEYFYDILHLNSAGHSIFGKALADCLAPTLRASIRP